MRRLSSLLAVALLAACGGGGGGNSLPSTPSAPHGGNGTMSLKVSFNRSGGNAVVRGGKRRNYVSYSTQGLGIDVVAHVNNGANTLPKTSLSALRTPEIAVSIAPNHTGNNVSCGAAVAGAFSCTILVPATAGYNDVQITAWDRAPDNGVEGVGGTFNGTAGVIPNDLSTNFFPQQLVLANQSNAFNFAMDGVVNSVSVTASVNSLVSGAQLGQIGTITTSLAGATLAGDTSFPVQSVVGLQPGDAVSIGLGGSQETLTIATIADGSSPSITTTAGAANAHNGGDAVSYTGPINPGTVTLSVNEFDAQGNRIIGSDPLVDAGGNTLTVSVQPSETAPGGGQIGDTGSAVTLSGSACTSNACSYTTPDGSAQVGYNGFDLASVQFAATVSCSASCVAPTGSLQTVPATIAFTRSTNGGLVIPGQPSITEVDTGFNNPYVGSAALGPDGFDWFTIAGGSPQTNGLGKIIKISPGANPSVTPVDVSGCGATAGTSGIAAGADGSMWFGGYTGSGPVLCAVATDGSNLRSYGNFGYSNSGASFGTMALDPSGLMWLPVDDGSGHAWALALQLQSDGTVNVLHTVDLGAGVSPSAATIGAVDHMVYVSDFNGAQMFQIDPNTASATALPIPAAQGRPSGITSVADGLGHEDVVVAEWGSGYVADYNTGTGSWTQTQVQNTGFDYCEAVTAGPEGTVWAGCDNNAVVQYNPANLTHALFSNNVNGHTSAAAPGSDNSVWFGEWGSGKVAKVTLP